LDDSLIEGHIVFLNQRRGIVQGGPDILSLKSWIVFQQPFYRIAIGQHSYDLMHWDTSTTDAGLAVANTGVNRNAL
jgi:hypothetical protein